MVLRGGAPPGFPGVRCPGCGGTGLRDTGPIDKGNATRGSLARDASGRRVEATRRVDPSIIGGIVIQAGSQRLDASVRGRLDQLRQELTARS